MIEEKIQKKIESEKKILEEIRKEKKIKSYNGAIKLCHLLLKTQTPTSSELLNSIIEINSERHQEACKLYENSEEKNKRKAIKICKEIIKSYLFTKKKALIESTNDIDSFDKLLKEFQNSFTPEKVSHNRYTFCKTLKEIKIADETPSILYIGELSDDEEENDLKKIILNKN